MASVQGSTGVVQDRGMCEEKLKDDRPEEGGTLNSGRRMAPVDEEIYVQRPNDFQPKGGVAKSHQESDLPIVVRDGNAGHKAKGRAGSNASIGISTGHEYSRRWCQTPCLQWESVLAPCVSAGSVCALS